MMPAPTRGTMVDVLDRYMGKRLLLTLSSGVCYMGTLYAVGADVITISDNGQNQALDHIAIAHIERFVEAGQ
jgi:hypothetical protein